MEEKQIIEKTQLLLDEFTAYIDNSVWRERYGMGLKILQQELNAPCVLAFAGKVKAGKSFLVNAAKLLYNLYVPLSTISAKLGSPNFFSM